jgi:hypothetical protein
VFKGFEMAGSYDLTPAQWQALAARRAVEMRILYGDGELAPFKWTQARCEALRLSEISAKARMIRGRKKQRTYCIAEADD